MKSKLNVRSAAALIAMLGITDVAFAESARQFIPVENLAPEQRQEVFDKVLAMVMIYEHWKYEIEKHLRRAA